MNYQHLLFSFDGRIRRMHYWLGLIGSILVYGVVAGVLITVAAAMNHGAGPGLIGVVLYLVVLVFAAWTGLALQIKRWHDRDKSWVWIFINFIPMIGALWTLVECGFLDGTPGPNRFGPSPKGITGPAAAPAVTATT
jgi:uncharacterized membrane protein YhaH (DUF805 family)